MLEFFEDLQMSLGPIGIAIIVGYALANLKPIGNFILSLLRMTGLRSQADSGSQPDAPDSGLNAADHVVSKREFDVAMNANHADHASLGKSVDRLRGRIDDMEGKLIERIDHQSKRIDQLLLIFPGKK